MGGGGRRGTHLGVLVGVHGTLHAEGLRAQDLAVSLQGIQLEQAGSRQQLGGGAERRGNVALDAGSRPMAQASGNRKLLRAVGPGFS